MISVGILDGVGSTGSRRRLPLYRLLAVLVVTCLVLITGSHFSHGSHNRQPSDVERRSLFDEPLRLNDSLVSLPRELFSRAADDATWARKVASGRSDDVVAGTVTLETLLSTGYEEDDEQDPVIPNDYRKSLGRADGLLNTANEVPRGWDHTKMWTGPDGRDRKPTTATYGNIVNGDDGYIIGGGNFGPAEAVKDLDPRDDPPPPADWPTMKWTDFLAVMWSQYAAGKELKRVYRSSVIMLETKQLMESALLKVNKLPSGGLDNLPLWPGIDFVPGRNPTKMPMTPAVEAFMGLLGSSHAAGAAYLFIQYRAIFGRKRVTKIKIWQSENVKTTNMLLYFER